MQAEICLLVLLGEVESPWVGGSWAVPWSVLYQGEDGFCLGAVGHCYELVVLVCGCCGPWWEASGGDKKPFKKPDTALGHADGCASFGDPRRVL